MNATRPCEAYRGGIEALRAGRFDALAADEMTALEAHLNACPACAGLLRDVAARPEAALRTDAPPIAEATWEGAWRAIDRAAARRTLGPVRIIRFVRPWGALAAAAALVLMAAVWWVIPRTAPPAWDFALARGAEVEIEALEVYGDATAMVVSAGEEDSIAVIWVVDETGA